jgi:ankyrin repeat protein
MDVMPLLQPFGKMYTEGKLTEAISGVLSLWDDLPSPKEKNSNSYMIFVYVVEMAIQSGNSELAWSWAKNAEIYKSIRPDSGEVELLQAKAAHCKGDIELADKLLEEAKYKSEGRISFSFDSKPSVSKKHDTTETNPKADDFLSELPLLELQELKRQYEADPEVIHLIDKNGFTTLHVLMSEEKFEVVKFLLNNGCDVNYQNVDGIAPLHIANYKENIEILVKNGANLHIKDIEGNTPCHLFALEGLNEELITLVSLGADPKIKNNAGDSALDLLRYRGEEKLLDYFNQ